MDLRARWVLSVIVGASIALGTSGCKHNTLDSGTQGLDVAFSPVPAATTRYTTGNFLIERLEVLPADPAAASVYGPGQTLVLRFDAFTGQIVPAQQSAFSQIALAQGVYKVTNLTIRHPVLTQVPAPTPPFAQCINGVQFLSIQNVSPNPGAPTNTIFTVADGITFTVRPGQTSLGITLDVQSFISAYEAAFTCSNVGCSNPSLNCLTGFSESAFRAAVLSSLRLE